MECKYCGKFFEGKTLAGHTVWCDNRPKNEIEKIKSKLSKMASKRRHSEETKKKLSEYRTQYIKDNPDKAPYKMNHSHKESYPEKYFSKYLVNFVHPYSIPDTAYEGDFVNPDSKVIIEIDGEQHYCDPIIVAHDIKRTRILEALGWRVLRVRWRDFVTLSEDSKKSVINNLNSYEIENFSLDNYVKPVNTCTSCGKVIGDYRSNRCKLCENQIKNIKNRKFELSSLEMIELLKTTSIEGIGRMFGVSSTAIRKRCSRLGIDLKALRETKSPCREIQAK